MGRPSPTPSSTSEDTSRVTSGAVSPPPRGSGGGSGGAPSTRNFKATQAASVAAVVESTNAHRHVIPGLAELMGGSSVVEMMKSFKNSGGGGGSGSSGGGGNGSSANDNGGNSSSEVMHTRIMNANTNNNNGNNNGGDNGDTIGNNSMDVETTKTVVTVGHPSLPSMDSVSTAVSKLINECPPFMTMSERDSAPQLQLEDPLLPAVVVATTNNNAGGSGGGADFQRRFVVKGGMKGYRMSRATHGVTSGCYYYEAVILGSPENGGGGVSVSGNASQRGVKRPLTQMIESTTATKKNDVPTTMQKERQTSSSNGRKNNGHIRIGWSTRNADLQAPVGYNEHSYGIRDILGSRIHKSRREDKWSGVGFGPGDVVGLAICLMDGNNKTASNNNNNATTPTNAGGANNAENKKKEDSISSQVSSKGDDDDVGKLLPSSSATTLTNHIRFFKNGTPMGKNNGIAFDDIPPGTYYPSVSCYMDGSARMNFGPRFVYPPPKGLLPDEISDLLRPISELCESPPLPEDVVETVISGGGGKDGKKVFFSKRNNDGIVSAFKELVKVEATARHDAYLKHLELHREEVAALRKERGLSTSNLERRRMPQSS